MKIRRILPFLLMISLLSGCASLVNSGVPTPLPTELLPTIIALTLEAGQAEVETSTLPASVTSIGLQPVATQTPIPTLISTLTPTSIPVEPTGTPFLTSQPPPGIQTPFPDIPEAAIQIYRPGSLSRVISPIRVSAYLKPGAVGLVRIELRGEDGRVLVRQIKAFDAPSSAWANLSLELAFEIAAAAEMARLVIGVDDEQGRTKALNSVDLILLSIGEDDINPSDAVQERIVIQQPRIKALIQGGTLLVSGVAHPFSDRPLKAQLVTDENKVVGMRLAGVTLPEEGGYGAFAVELPYTVSELTPARLILYEDGENISEIRYLASREIVLSP